MIDKMLAQIRIIDLIKKLSLEKTLVNEFTAEQIFKLADTITKNNFQKESYANCCYIQSELIENPDFVQYLKTTAADASKSKFLNNVIDSLNKSGKKITDYNAALFESLYDFCGYCNINTVGVITDFLESCKNRKGIDNKLFETVFRSIKHYYSNPTEEGSVCSFTDDEFEIFIKPFMTKIIPADKAEINKFCKVLSKNKELSEFFQYVYDKDIEFVFESVILNITSDTNIVDSLKSVIDSINHKHYIKVFFDFWKEDNYLVGELKTFEAFCGIGTDEITNILNSKVKYLNVIYGNKYPFIAEMSEDSVNGKKENLYIYAVTSNKKAFLKLIENNMEIFETLNRNSIIFNQNFRKHVNINSLNISDIKKAKNMTEKRGLDILWKCGRQYTFNEICEFYECTEKYLNFYLMLDIPRVDDRLLVFKQVKKHRLLSVCTNGDETVLAEKLSVKGIFVWLKEEFAHIKDIDPLTAAKLLLIYDKMKHLISGAENITEAHFLTNNRYNDTFENAGDMDYIRDNLLEIDVMWKKLREILNLSDEYVNENKKNILDFCMKNGAEIAVKYYTGFSSSDKRKKSFLKVVKSVISDKFYMLKYYDKDLSIEIQAPISDIQKKLWTENTVYEYNNIKIAEEDDFFSTMLMGTKPVKTCMDYSEGIYNECLLSNFDSNKKVIYVYVNGTAVGRAILRFTKGVFGKSENDTDNRHIDFVDIDNIENKNTKIRKSEFPVIFLERGYFSEVNKEFETILRKQMVDFVENKAIKMGVTPVISDGYGYALAKSDKYIKQVFNVFISLSKAGSQYLDSLGGNAGISDEGKFYKDSFYLPARK